MLGGGVGRAMPQWDKSSDFIGGGNAGGEEERILVSVRLRPLNAMEATRSDISDWECVSATTVVFNSTIPERAMYPSAYSYDRVFGCNSTTKQVYEEGAKEVALSVVRGINSSVFAYGQTSSGKTYTMTGITAYSVEDIYGYIQKHKEREFILRFSAMEIYNESVRDLLSADSTPLRLLDDPERGTVVEKLTEETLRDCDHLHELLTQCEAQRQIGETSLNEVSSRSHQILRLTIESFAREFLGKDNSSTLTASVNFVDLAGSERASQAMSAGTRLKEGCHINRSLLTLGTVIRKLSKGRNGHVPYRDSKLTRILQNSLGGNARTAIICTMSPARSHIEQSRNTLLFATCAKEVVTNAQVNVVMSDKALVKHLQKELARMESELKFPGSVSVGHSEALKEKEDQIRKMEKEIKDLMQQRDLAQSQLEDVLRNGGDNQASRQWDELSQYSLQHMPSSIDDAFSVSETSVAAYQNSHFSSRHSTSSHQRSDSIESCLQLFDQINDHGDTSPTNSVGGPGFIELVPYQEPNEGSHYIVPCQEPVESSQNTFEEFKGHWKEVSQIENEETLTSKRENHPPLLTGSYNLHPQNLDDDTRDHGYEPKADAVVGDSQEGKLQSDRKETTVKSFLYQPSLWYANDLTYTRSPAVRKTMSCRFLPSPSWFQEAEMDDRIRLKSLKEYLHESQDESPKDSSLANSVCQIKEHLVIKYPISQESTCTDSFEVKGIKTNYEENVTEGILCTGMKKRDHMDCQNELTDEWVKEKRVNEHLAAEKAVKDEGVYPKPSPFTSPLISPWDFEKKQKEIIGLWNACNVSLLHRTYFFLLINGDPSDSVYMEVERRRLSFLEKASSNRDDTGHVGKTTLSSSVKNLRREREKLCRKMHRKLSVKERTCLYSKWGIALDSKQRTSQLVHRLWTETGDMEHVRESAFLVAKLTGLLKPGAGLKEMFSLNFTPQLANRSFSWK